MATTKRDDIYERMYSAGLRGYLWSMPDAGYTEDEFDAWMMGFIDGINDAGYGFDQLQFDTLSKVLKMLYPDWWPKYVSKYAENLHSQDWWKWISTNT